MNYLYIILKLMLVFSFLCHSYMVLAPALDEIGYLAVLLHALLATISWVLYLISNTINKKE